MTEQSSSISRRGVLGAFAGVAGLAVFAEPAWAAGDPRPGAVTAPTLTVTDKHVVKRVSATEAIERIRVLSEDIGPRIGGTASEKAAADYLADYLRKQGCEVRLEPFPVADKFLAQVGDPDGQLPDDLCWQAGASPDAGLDTSVTAAAVDVKQAAAPTWPADGVSGKVVLADDIQDTDPVARVQRRAAFVADAQARGAGAVVLLPMDGTYPRRAQAASLRLVPGTPAPPPQQVATIPVVGVAQVQKHRLREDLAVRSLRLTISTAAHRGLTSYNVIGERVGKNKAADAPLVYVSGHYDSVIGAPGANDDGSGTALTVELARALRAVPMEHTVRFALWGSEEQGLIGSRYHVAQLDQVQRDRIVAVFQNDMVATSWDPATRYWLLSFDGKANAATQAVAAAATRLGYTEHTSPVTQRGSSDHQSFQEVGIASANFSWRGEASPALLEPPYHSPEDTIAKNISAERLKVSLELIGCAMAETARAV